MQARIVQNGARSETRLARKAVGLGWLAAAVLCLATPACSPPQGAAATQSQGPGGPFILVNQDGRPTDQSILKGKWSVVFFGYTFCPDFCPTTLTVLGRAMDQLGPKAKDVQVVFVSVDPARDTPAELKTYLSAKVFPKNIVGLTGSPAQVAQAAKAYGVYFQKAGSGPNYTVDHSTALYLMNSQGQYETVIADGLPPDKVAQQISQAMAGA